MLYGFFIDELPYFIENYKHLGTKHSYDFYCIFYINAGSGIISVDEEVYKTEPGTIILISPGQQLSFKADNNINGYAIFFCQDFYIIEFSLLRLLYLYSFTWPASKRVERHCIKICNSLTWDKNFFPLLMNEYKKEQKKEKKEQIFRSYLNILLIKLLDELDSETNESAKTANILVLRLSQILETQFMCNREPSAYAILMGISVDCLNLLCKEAFNQSFKNLVQDRLMFEARKMLTTSNLTIAEIAYKLNFSDNSNFSKFFKRHIGITPQRFRKIHEKLVP